MAVSPPIADRQPVFGTPGDDESISGVTPNFDGIGNYIFAGLGNDTIDLSGAGNSNRVYGGPGSDELFAGRSDRLFGGEGEDNLDSTSGLGDNLLFGGRGNDNFFLGSGDRASGGAGDDRFFAADGGGNRLAGGTGSDRFFVVSGERPAVASTIVDFDAGVDLIGISGIGASFEQLQRQGETISVDGQLLAILLGVNTASLAEADFILD